MFGAAILVNGDIMENTAPLLNKEKYDYDSLILASILLLGASRMIVNVHKTVAYLLRYAAVGISIACSLIGMTLSAISLDNQ